MFIAGVPGSEVKSKVEDLSQRLFLEEEID